MQPLFPGRVKVHILINMHAAEENLFKNCNLTAESIAGLWKTAICAIKRLPLNRFIASIKTK
jgi:hypothetical protein